MNNIGNLGEQVFSYKMREAGYTIQNVSADPSYWDVDTDFIVTSPSGNTRTFEVKYDTRISQTGNLYLELFNIHSKGGLGWFQFCQADFLAYGDATSKVFYIIPMEKLRERAQKLPQRMTNCGTDSIGQLINLRDITDITKTI